MAAAALGVPVSWVRVAYPVDTKYSPYEWQTVASRLTWSMGNAIAAAARDARQQILTLVAQAWNEDINDLDIVDGNVISYKTEESHSLKDLAIYGLPKPDGKGWIGGPILGGATSCLPISQDWIQRLVRVSVPRCTTLPVAQAVEVEVDMDTGRVQVIKAVAAFDVGKAINPEAVRTQMEGGLVQGISTALFEALQIKKGFVQNPSLVDYRIATSVDVPARLETIIVEVPRMTGRGGRAASASTPWCRPSRRLPMPSMMPLASALAIHRSRRSASTWPWLTQGS